MIREAVCIGGVLVAAIAHGQDLGVKAPAQPGPIAIENAMIHPVSGPVIESGHVLFDKGIIVSVGPGAAPRSGENAQIIDGAGKHVYPGLIAPYTLMGLTEIGAARATNDYAEVGDVSPEVRAAVAVNPDSTVIPVTRSNGILTCGVLPMGGLVPGRAAVIRMDGWTWEDLALDADAGVIVNWPIMRPSRGWWVTTTREEQEKRAKEQLDRIERAFDAARAYFAARDADPQLPLDVRWEGMRATVTGEDPVFIRAQEVEQIESAVMWAVRMGLRPVIVGGRDAALAADLLKRHDVPVIVAGTFRMPRRDDAGYDDAYTLPARLQEAGVRWCMGSSTGMEDTPYERSLPYEAGMASAFGLARDAALRAVTLSAAEILGVDKRIGSIEKGKAATLIVTTGDPVEVTTRTERAFIDGREIDLSNKQTALEAKYREKYRQLGILQDDTDAKR